MIGDVFSSPRDLVYEAKSSERKIGTGADAQGVLIVGVAGRRNACAALNDFQIAEASRMGSGSAPIGVDPRRRTRGAIAANHRGQP
jgi:hypothetical protein